MSAESLILESWSLPSDQLARLLADSSAEVPGLMHEVASGPAHRGIDPTVAAAVVTGAFGLLVPFMTKLAEKLFAAEPDARLSVEGLPSAETVVLTATMSTEDTAEVLAKALAGGARRVQVTVVDEA